MWKWNGIRHGSLTDAESGMGAATRVQEKATYQRLDQCAIRISCCIWTDGHKRIIVKPSIVSQSLAIFFQSNYYTKKLLACTEDRL